MDCIDKQRPLSLLKKTTSEVDVLNQGAPTEPARLAGRIRAMVRACCLVSVLVPCGCVHYQPKTQHAPLLTPDDSFGELDSHSDRVAALVTPWWHSFEDTSLNELVERGLEGNFELEGLAQRIEQAESRLRQAGAALFPALEGRVDYDRRWPEGGSGDSERSGQSSSVGSLFSWEVDLFGRLRFAREARRLEHTAAEDDWQAGRLLLSGAIAEVYFQIQEQRQELRLIREQININQTLLELTRLRFGQGLTSIVDVLQQQEQLDSTQTLVPDVEARLKELEYLLAVLLGKRSKDIQSFPIGLLVPPPALPNVGVPSLLLSNRPDLRAVGGRLAALDQRVGQALAERLPRLSIRGLVEGAGDPGFGMGSGSLTASLVGPFFEAGARKAEVDLRRSELQEAAALFSNFYLVAIQEVKTALWQQKMQEEKVELLETQLGTAQRLMRETRNRYSQGLTDYLPVLDALTTLQNLERDIISSRRRLLSFRIALHRALGGPMEERVLLSQIPTQIY